MRDEEIVRLLKRRQEEGMTALIEAYGHNVEWMAGKILGACHREDVEECVSDIYMKVWQEIEAYREEKGSLLLWIYGIARHTAIDRWRKIAGKQTVPLADFGPQEKLGIQPDFTNEISGKENARVIREAVHAMKAPDRHIFLMRYFYFLPVREIAARLGLSDKQVENRLRRGRKRLRKELMQKGVMPE